MNRAFSKIWIVFILCILIVGGIFVWQYLLVPKEEKDETIAWKVYRNKEYGFEVKYPKEWFITEDTRDGIAIITNFLISDIGGRGLLDKETKIIFSVYDNPEMLSAEEWGDRQLAETTILSKKEIKISGVRGIQIEICHPDLCLYGSDIVFFLPLSKTMLDITNLSNRDKFNQILSTFQFLE